MPLRPAPAAAPRAAAGAPPGPRPSRPCGHRPARRETRGDYRLEVTASAVSRVANGRAERQAEAHASACAPSQHGDPARLLTPTGPQTSGALFPPQLMAARMEIDWIAAAEIFDLTLALEDALGARSAGLPFP